MIDLSKADLECLNRLEESAGDAAEKLQKVLDELKYGTGSGYRPSMEELTEFILPEAIKTFKDIASDLDVLVWEHTPQEDDDDEDDED